MGEVLSIKINTYLDVMLIFERQLKITGLSNCSYQAASCSLLDHILFSSLNLELFSLILAFAIRIL
jgi:hypothetical protein